MIIKNLNKSDGYTLIEMLLYVALIGLISLVVAGVFVTVSRANNKVTSFIEVNSNITGAMNRMIYEIKNADSVYTPTSNFINYGVDSGKPQLSLATALGAPAGESLVYLDFYLENNTIFFKQEGINPIALTSPNVLIQSLSFSYYKNGSRELVKIDFIAKPNSGLNSNSAIHLITTAALRS